MKTVTLTELRKNIFQLIDEVVATGEPLVIERKGKRLTLKGETASKDETRAEADERWRAFWAQPPRPGRRNGI
jgi:antitoxin (DNA-binding transcriptional repressor) of toxin-antitoxin stability system